LKCAISITKSTLFIICLFLCLAGFTQNNDSLNFKVFGFSQVRAFYYSETFNQDDGQINFEVNKIRLGVNGKITKKVGYLFLCETGAVSSNGQYSFAPLDAYLTYRVSDFLKINIGQDWYKFGWEYSQPIPQLPFINFADFVSNILDSMGRNGNYGYDIGIWANGKKELNKFSFGYNSGITNGTGLNKFDNNNYKDLYVRIYLEYNKNIHIGSSFFKGISKINNENLGEYACGFEARYLSKLLNIGTEYIFTRYSKSKDNPDQLSQKQKSGYYIYGEMSFLEKFKGLIRFEENRGLNYQEDKSQVVCLGLTYRIKSLNNIKFNYIIKEYGTKDIISCVMLQLQVIIN